MIADDTRRRERLRKLPFAEKLKLLERLRDRSRVIAAVGLRRQPVRPGEPETDPQPPRPKP